LIHRKESKTPQLENLPTDLRYLNKATQIGAMVGVEKTQPVGFAPSRREIMTTIAIKADESLWQNNMLPEGVVVRWFVADGALARAGHRMAEVRIEGALHDIIAPANGRVKIEMDVSSVIEPGSLLATLAPIA
jgi:hypothetical protein